MSKILQRHEATLRCFYIFNSKFGAQEGEEYKKILYYTPQDIELNTKIKDVGLTEAIIQFTGTFLDDDCKALHTQKTTQLFYQPEFGYWMVMVLNVPKEVKSKDGIEVPEYRGAEVQDRIYRTVLREAYNVYRLKCGTFESLVSASDREKGFRLEKLQEMLIEFFNEYLKSIRIPVTDVFNYMHSTQYLPLEQALFLRSHNFINIIRATVPIIKETMLLYDERVISNGRIGSREMCCLHQHLMNFFDKCNTRDNRSIQSPESTIADKYKNGAYITGPISGEPITTTGLPKVYLRLDDVQLSGYYLIIYRILNITLCLLISDADEPPMNRDFYTNLQSQLKPYLSDLSEDIEKYISNQKSARKANSSVALSVLASPSNNSLDMDTSSPKYIFINEQSLKHLTNIPTGNPMQNIPANVLNLIADLIPISEEAKAAPSTMTEQYTAALREVHIKTTNDFWIVQHSWNWRQCYVIIHNSKATLLDVTQEAKLVFNKEFKDGVFFDK